MKTSPSGLPGAAAEPDFLLAAQRMARNPRDKVAIVVHLSRLRLARSGMPPAHQLRLARSILGDAAQRYEGQVFVLRNGDMALLCRNGGKPADAPGTLAVEPSTIPGVLSRLFNADAGMLLSVWPLTTQREMLLSYAADRLAEFRPGPGVPAATVAAGERSALTMPALGSVSAASAGVGSHTPDAPGATSTIDAITTLLAGTRLTDLMHRQTAVCLSQAPGGVQPLFREISFSIAALEARIATLGQAGQAGADAFLFRHLATRLDARMLATLLHELGRGGPLDAAATAGSGLGLHLNLTLPTVRSEAFSRLLTAYSQVEGQLGIEISFVEVSADPAAWRYARELTARHGVTLVLDGVSPLAMRLTRPWLLQPDLVKFEWLPRLPGIEGVEQTQIQEGLQMLGTDRVVLHRAETEAAVTWGQSQGITRFQGRHIDAMLGAGRIMHCPLSNGCTLRQCIERGAALTAAGRSGCGNTTLLDGSDINLRSRRARRPPDNSADGIGEEPVAPSEAAIEGGGVTPAGPRRRRGAAPQ